MLRRQVLRSAAEIAAIAPAWQALARACGPVMTDPDWFACAARCVHGDARIHVVTGWDGETLAAVAPLVLSRAGGAPRYEILGARVLYEPVEMLVRDAAAAAWLAREVAGLGRPLLLARLPASGAFHDAFAAQARGRGLLLAARSTGAPYVELAGGFEAYHARLKTHTRSELRRRLRKLQAVGAVSTEFVMPAEAEAMPLLLEAFEVEARSWKGRRGSAILLRDDLRAFFTDYGQASARRGELHVSMLRLDGKAIATHVATVDGRAYRQLKIGFDDAYAAYSPGLQLLLETVKWSFARGLATHELLGGEEAWSREWSSAVHACTTTVFYPYTVRGVAGLARDGVSRVLAKAASRLARKSPAST